MKPPGQPLKGGGEHKKDLEFRRTKSHMLRHIVEKHPEVDPDEVPFKMRILSNHKSAFERQIREAVMIEHFAGPQLLNSKLEYNRCSIPKIILKLGNEELSEDPKLKTEKSTIEKIKLLFKGEKKRQKNEAEIYEIEDQNETKKRRKLDESEGGFQTQSSLNVDEIGLNLEHPKISQNVAKSDTKGVFSGPKMNESDKCPNNLPPKIGQKVAKNDLIKRGLIGQNIKDCDKALMSDKSGPDNEKVTNGKNVKIEGQNDKSDFKNGHSINGHFKNGQISPKISDQFEAKNTVSKVDSSGGLLELGLDCPKFDPLYGNKSGHKSEAEAELSPIVSRMPPQDSSEKATKICGGSVPQICGKGLMSVSRSSTDTLDLTDPKDNIQNCDFDTLKNNSEKLSMVTTADTDNRLFIDVDDSKLEVVEDLKLEQDSKSCMQRHLPPNLENYPVQSNSQTARDILRKHDVRPFPNIENKAFYSTPVKRNVERGTVLVKRDKVRLSTSPKKSSKSKYDYRSPNNRKSVSKSDKKESKAIKRDKIDVMNDKKSSKSKVKDIINAFENNITVKSGNSDDPKNVDSSKVKDAFKVMMVKSNSNWGALSPISPRVKSLKRIRKNKSNSPGKPSMLQEWLKREKI